MYTVITKGNKVRQYNSIDGVNRDIKHSCIVVNKIGTIIERSSGASGNTITWPAEATSGLQAIVDVKAGTLRFSSAQDPRAQTEFVVSEYVEPVTAPHIFDQVDNWPQQHRGCLGTMPLPEGWEWKWFGYDWVLSNGTIGLKREDWFKYKFGEYVESVASAPTIGTKHDHGKPILGAVPPHAELAVGRVLTFGAEKYARGNWDKVEDHENRYMDAALRHLNAHRRGELTDNESGESHLAHAACCILFMLDNQERS